MAGMEGLAGHAPAVYMYMYRVGGRRWKGPHCDTRTLQVHRSSIACAPFNVNPGRYNAILFGRLVRFSLRAGRPRRFGQVRSWKCSTRQKRPGPKRFRPWLNLRASPLFFQHPARDWPACKARCRVFVVPVVERPRGWPCATCVTVSWQGGQRSCCVGIVRAFQAAVQRHRRLAATGRKEVVEERVLSNAEKGGKCDILYCLSVSSCAERDMKRGTAQERTDNCAATRFCARPPALSTSFN